MKPMIMLMFGVSLVLSGCCSTKGAGKAACGCSPECDCKADSVETCMCNQANEQEACGCAAGCACKAESKETCACNA
jgi:hypothetical protein